MLRSETLSTLATSKAASPWRTALRQLACLGLALGLALLGLGSVLQAANPDPGLERDLIALTNVDRTSNGLSALVEDGRLVPIARERSDDMLARNYFSHSIPPAGIKVFELIKGRGITYQTAGENLAFNNAQRAGSVQFAEQSFMNSPTHRSNILNSAYNVIGVGAVPGADRIMYTVLFMRPTAAPAAPAAPPPAQPAAPARAAAPAPAEQQTGGTREGEAPAIALESGPNQVLDQAGQLSEEDLAPSSPIELVIDSVIGRSLHVPGSE